MTRGGVDERREVLVAGVGVGVGPGLLGPQAGLADVVVDLVHPQSAASAGVGS